MKRIIKRPKQAKTLRWIGLVFVAVAMLFLFTSSSRAEENNPQGVSCVTWTAEAPFVGLAYNHLVQLKNTCDHAVVCRIKTDVNPKEETISIPEGGKKTQLTFRGSPAREFKATVTCVKR